MNMIWIDSAVEAWLTTTMKFILKTRNSLSRCFSRSLSATSSNPAVGFIGKTVLWADSPGHGGTTDWLCSGLGNMGRGMAANLVTKGHSVLVYDVAPGAVSELGKDYSFRAQNF